MNDVRVSVAHVRQLPTGDWAAPHLLLDHLQEVARIAGDFAAPFGNSDWASLAGLWHDLGKYKADFQHYIREVSGYERDEAEEGGPGKVDHTAAGAIHACKQLGRHGQILAYLIAGHHSGLPDWYKAEAKGRGLLERLAEPEHLAASLLGEPPAEILAGNQITTGPCGGKLAALEFAHLWVRMLFSCLVDADFLDTEAYMDPEKGSERTGGQAPLLELRARYDAYMEKMQADAPTTPINLLRRRILDECRQGACKRPGFFSLTVPTGGGKTLASMGFALDHALLHRKRRIVVVIPYTSIIEQTAEVLRAVFGNDAVLEHHSNLDPERETTKSKLATENWDAPIVVTTNVQLFESLFAARTSACRKLHNVVDSVLVLDEAQMLPPEFLKPILSALRGLVAHFGVTTVLCTATQPALEGHIGGRAHGPSGGFSGLSDVVELMSDRDALAEAFRRVELVSRDVGTPTPWSELAAELSLEPQVLCIVNTRKDCRELHALLPAGTTHLSALMCGEHRSQVIKQVKAALKDSREIRVVSTQLVEAGVDLDFPIVFRAMAGLDSIAQAAGRCNREGRLPEGELGRVVVFAPPKPAPPGLLRQGEDTCRELFRTEPELAMSLRPDAFRRYFEQFFHRIESFDRRGIIDLLSVDACSFQFQFRTAAQRFKLIDDSAQRSIFVWYESSRIKGRDLVEELRRTGPYRKLMRRLQRCSVTVPERAWKDLLDQGAIEELRGPDGPLQLWAQAVPELYDEIFGLRLEGPNFRGDEYVL